MWIKFILPVWNCLPAVCPRIIRRKKPTREHFMLRRKAAGTRWRSRSLSVCLHLLLFTSHLQLISGGASLATSLSVSKGDLWARHAVLLLRADNHVAAVSHLTSTHTHTISPWHQELVIAPQWPAASSPTFITMLSFKHRVTFRKYHSDHNLPHICRKWFCITRFHTLCGCNALMKEWSLLPFMEVLKRASTAGPRIASSRGCSARTGWRGGMQGGKFQTSSINQLLCAPAVAL